MQIKNINRLLLKISGEMLSGEQEFGLSPLVLEDLAQKVKTVHSEGIEVGIVIGGGIIFRGMEFIC